VQYSVVECKLNWALCTGGVKSAQYETKLNTQQHLVQTLTESNSGVLGMKHADGQTCHLNHDFILCTSWNGGGGTEKYRQEQTVTSEASLTRN